MWPFKSREEKAAQAALAAELREKYAQQIEEGKIRVDDDGTIFNVLASSNFVTEKQARRIIKEEIEKAFRQCDLKQNFNLEKGRRRNYGNIDIIISETGDIEDAQA